MWKSFFGISLSLNFKDRSWNQARNLSSNNRLWKNFTKIMAMMELICGEYATKAPNFILFFWEIEHLSRLYFYGAKNSKVARLHGFYHFTGKTKFRPEKRSSVIFITPSVRCLPTICKYSSSLIASLFKRILVCPKIQATIWSVLYWGKRYLL